MTAGRFSPALEQIRLSPIVAISEEARDRAVEFEKSGRPFLRFQRGEIDFPTPPHIVAALKDGVDKGLTRYPRSGGESYFKDAVLQKMSADHGVDDITDKNIVATYGGQEGLELTFRLFKSGAGFSPTWSCVLENFVPFAQSDFVEVPLNDDFSVDYDLLDRSVKGREFFYLNNPQNPTGKVFREDELIRIVEICTKHGCYIVSDESYEKIVYDGGEHYSLAKIQQDNVITVFTLSKTYAMTGWRLGYTITRDEHVAKLLRLGNYTQTAGVTTFLQYAGAAALADREASEYAISEMLAEFELRRNALYDGLNGVPGVKIDRPEGAFYMFPNFTQVIPRELSGDQRRSYIYNKLLEHGICTVYGSCFGKYFDDNVRLSFSGTPVPVIEELVGRFREIFS